MTVTELYGEAEEIRRYTQVHTGISLHGDLAEDPMVDFFEPDPSSMLVTIGEIRNSVTVHVHDEPSGNISDWLEAVGRMFLAEASKRRHPSNR